MLVWSNGALVWMSTTTLVAAVYCGGVRSVTRAAVATVTNTTRRMTQRRALQICRRRLRFTRLAPDSEKSRSENAFLHVEDIVGLQDIGQLNAPGRDLVPLATLERDVFLARPRRQSPADRHELHDRHVTCQADPAGIAYLPVNVEHVHPRNENDVPREETVVLRQVAILQE